MFCTHCGTALPTQAQFCQACGKAVAASAASPNWLDAQVNKPTTFSAPESFSSSKSQTTEETDVNQVRPWVRFFARTIDISLWAITLGVLWGIFAPQLPITKENEYATGLLALFTWVFVEPFCLSTFGTTPGKFLLKTRLIYNAPHALTYGQALKRSAKVWWRGLAAGFPLINLGTLIYAYRMLRANGRTTWDAEEGFRVSHGRIGTGRGLLVVALLLVFFAALVVGSIPEN
ncbi:RDD family protein [Comamonas sp. UBA7528]|uniref:RDD family protein n=1 Tax=Comamonas sp. UBA7528 TaxID=1946391 RepID=UPI0025B9D2A4|nr:RDD family protein [Comamonas sp. UBA7528]